MQIVIELPLPPWRTSCNVNKRAHGGKEKVVRDIRELARVAALPHMAGGQIQGRCIIHHVWFMGYSPFEQARLDSIDQIRSSNARRKRDGLPKLKEPNPIHARPHDEQNAIACLKPHIDGIVDSGLLKNDSYKYVKWGEFIPLTTQEQHKGKSALHIILEYGEDAGKGGETFMDKYIVLANCAKEYKKKPADLGDRKSRVSQKVRRFPDELTEE